MVRGHAALGEAGAEALGQAAGKEVGGRRGDRVEQVGDCRVLLVEQLSDATADSFPSVAAYRARPSLRVTISGNGVTGGLLPSPS